MRVLRYAPDPHLEANEGALSQEGYHRWRRECEFCCVPEEPDSFRLDQVEVMDEMGKALWSARTRWDVSSLLLGKVLSHYRRASEDDIQSVEDDVGEDLWGDSPGVHGQAQVPALYGLRGEGVGIFRT
jgi:hypothetical protein